MKTRVASAFLSFLIVGLGARAASAHFELDAPPSWNKSQTGGGKGGPPCDTGEASGVVTKVKGGSKLQLKLRETVVHAGHYRVALATQRSELPKDPAVTSDGGGDSISAAIDKAPKLPILADGLFVHTTSDITSNHQWMGEVTLPNITCPKCTLQIIEFMAQHGAPYFYYHCADLEITADSSLPTDPGSGGTTGGSADAGAPIDAAAAAGKGGSTGGKGGGTGSGGTGGDIAGGGAVAGNGGNAAGGAAAGGSTGGRSAGATGQSGGAGAAGSGSGSGDSGGGCSYGASAAPGWLSLVGLSLALVRRKFRRRV